MSEAQRLGELADCPECGNAYLAIKTDVYKDKREFIYCDCCGAMATRPMWQKAALAHQADGGTAGQLKQVGMLQTRATGESRAVLFGQIATTDATWGFKTDVLYIREFSQQAATPPTAPQDGCVLVEAEAAALWRALGEAEDLGVFVVGADGTPCDSLSREELVEHLSPTAPQYGAPAGEVVDGEKLWLWKNGDHFLAFRHLYPCFTPGGDPMALGEPVGYAIFKESHDRSEARASTPPVAAPHFMSIEAVQQRAAKKEVGRIERLVGAIEAAKREAEPLLRGYMGSTPDGGIDDHDEPAPEARETAEPIGFITEEALRLLRDPEWLAQRGTYANLWGTDGPPNRAIVPVFAAPVSQPEALPLKSMNWHPGPIKTEWGDGMLVADVELSPDQTLTMFIHKNALPLLKDKP